MPDDEPMLTIQLRLPRSLVDQIDRYRFATAMRPSRSMMMRYLIESAITQLFEKGDEDNARNPGD